MAESVVSLHDLCIDYWNKALHDDFKSFIETPNISPCFGHQEHALTIVKIITQYIDKIGLECLTIIDNDEGYSPFMIINVNFSSSGKKVGFYCHADKQPPLTEKWSEGLHPYKLVEVENKLYGRGNVDDGYAIFTVLNMLALMQKNLNHKSLDNYVLLIEMSEESGSCHLKHYLDKHHHIIKDLKYLFVVDSGGPSLERLWITTSFRGCFMGELKVKVASKAQHSGEVGGIVPHPFFILNDVLSRLVKESYGVVSFDSDKELSQSMEVPDEVEIKCDVIDSIKQPSKKILYNNNVHFSSVSIIGLDGLPSVKDGGNIIVPEITAKLSIRVSSMFKIDEIIDYVKRILEEEHHSGAEITFTSGLKCDGWHSKTLTLEKEINEIVSVHYKKSIGYVGCGGSIPIMSMLESSLPECEIIATGILTPESNAHGPDEHLDIPTLHKFTKSLIDIIQLIAKN
jgi:acetylornithine deacetylase/succinyl-diaminopimelate desuccinylase-like protein